MHDNLFDAPIKLDIDLQAEWNELAAQAYDEISSLTKRNLAWSARTDELIDARVDVLMKQNNRDMWRTIGWVVGLAALVAGAIIAAVMVFGR